MSKQKPEVKRFKDWRNSKDYRALDIYLKQQQLRAATLEAVVSLVQAVGLVLLGVGLLVYGPALLALLKEVTRG